MNNDPEQQMPERPIDGGQFPADRYENPEAALGGADAVEKTTYVTGSGTEPETQRSAATPAAKVSSGGGNSTTWIVLAFLLVGAVLVYLLGFGR